MNNMHFKIPLDDIDIDINKSRIVISQQDRTQLYSSVIIEQNHMAFYEVVKQIFSEQYEQEMQSAIRKAKAEEREEMKQALRQMLGVTEIDDIKEIARNAAASVYANRK